ncbi:MAG: zinc ABC transporter substrate-binding protein [Clostridiales bacterium]|nr:zinc ABC transporter substrate-binding protein [Clostridiales bacterium]
MKKILSVLMAVLLIIAVFSACKSTEKAEENVSAGKRVSETEGLKIVATTFPQYDWLREVLGEHIENTELILLIDDGVDLHSFQPTVEDIAKVSDCDILVYTGGESDGWVQDAIKTAKKGFCAISLVETLGNEGMHEHPHEHEPEHEHEVDEHVWLSLKNAGIICKAIEEKLSELDPKNAEDYRKNAEVYLEKLSKLDSEYETAVSIASQNTVIFADRFPFIYLLDDYGLNYYAAFSGCSAETEASFETIAFLSDKLSELGLSGLVVIETSDKSIARAILQNSGSDKGEIFVMDSMQSVTLTDVKAGYTYLGTMEKNLEALKGALK